MASANSPFPTDSSDSSVEHETELFLVRAAKAEGLTIHQFNEKYGIIGASQERRIRRHEVLAADLHPGLAPAFDDGRSPRV